MVILSSDLIRVANGCTQGTGSLEGEGKGQLAGRGDDRGNRCPGAARGGEVL